VRREILTAAEALFASRGFAGTTTRAVAQSAGVSEALVYTHFGSKIGLFEAAVVDRYESFVTEYVGSWTALLEKPSAGSRHDFIYGLVSSFADFFASNRDILLTYLEYHRIGDGQAFPPAANFAAPLRQLEAALALHREDFGFRELDGPRSGPARRRDVRRNAATLT
jgi:AcrR family transcriptional regulator